MIDPSSKAGRDLKAAEEFFELAKNASSPFMRTYYRRVAERYLSSQGELKSMKRPADVAIAAAYNSGLTIRWLRCLRQHDVPGGEGSVGREAPSPCHVPLGSELFDVHGRSAADSVARAGVGAHHLETLVFVVLFGLVGRKPLAEES
jgi:hypothetical protein